DAPDALRDRGQGYLQLGYLPGAREDLGRYLMRHPDADDAAQVRAQLIESGRAVARRH
ncbi:tetratricopeptide repeat protein, partial [Pantoea sp. SIMBA_079]